MEDQHIVALIASQHLLDAKKGTKPKDIEEAVRHAGDILEAAWKEILRRRQEEQSPTSTMDLGME